VQNSAKFICDNILRSRRLFAFRTASPPLATKFHHTTMATQQPPAQGAGGEDYLDKALDAVEKKAGQMSGHPVDTNRYRDKNEKITDKIRAFIEKKTGKKLPGKVSN